MREQRSGARARPRAGTSVRERTSRHRDGVESILGQKVADAKVLAVTETLELGQRELSLARHVNVPLRHEQRIRGHDFLHPAPLVRAVVIQQRLELAGDVRRGPGGHVVGIEVLDDRVGFSFPQMDAHCAQAPSYRVAIHPRRRSRGLLVVEREGFVGGTAIRSYSRELALENVSERRTKEDDSGRNCRAAGPREAASRRAKDGAIRTCVLRASVVQQRQDSPASRGLV